ncbi:peroxidase-related enzyme [Fulvivirga sediminis]|uniref:Peroxidase-related enzyme n=1 Tax=Fulvivirga sediminis TaxID=2803949 RepID=A0A937F985_9BACT|nr:peroxidase-related enzyme [Fulvivirga sediminis]MBL3656954.1 peroxidase-related enzyme [Fulvivirga sediminis]
MNVKTISPEEATETLQEVYSTLKKNRGKVASLYEAQSLNPQTLKRSVDFNIEVMFGASPLKRYQKEMLAVMVSVFTDCYYSLEHHKEALSSYWKADHRVTSLIEDYSTAEIGRANRALCAYAEALTKNFDGEKVREIVQRMRELGLSDREVLDAATIISYINFQVKMVKGLGVELEPDGGVGYWYD